ncbi:MAG: 30S ribosome-binding factor RbfA [Deltaproteobacteria bacterium]|nr:30S ribosome-binding factor RbfA [Deltaproteobacteria bacterium]
MGEFKRSSRVSEGIRIELAAIIQEGALRDPDVGYVTITDAVATDDLRHARVFVSIYGEPAVQAKTMAALQRAAAFLRRELGPRLRLRFTPELEFVQDTSLERGARIEGLLKRIEKGETSDEAVSATMPGALPVSTGREHDPVVAPPPPPVKKPPKKKGRFRKRR